MTIKIHFITELLIGPVPSWWMNIDKHPLEKCIALIGGFVIITVITLELFKRNFIDSTGLIFGLWLLMSFDNAGLKSRNIKPLSYLLICLHITVALYGLTYWIRSSVREYNKKNTRPTNDLVFEIGAWLFMFIFNCTVVAAQHTQRNKEYKITEWYQVAVAFTSIVESYWKRGRKVRENLLKSQLIKNVEDAFHDFVRTFMKQPQSGNKIELIQKLNDFIRMFCILVAQRREDLTIAYQ
uniref:Uncharacterized protein S29SE2 n=1 Tax=Ipomoea trifida TaxID=35884 RepID=A4PHP3_IPOTF|nr:hypothetical protein [Ipomoea trifida]